MWSTAKITTKRPMKIGRFFYERDDNNDFSNYQL